MLRKMIYLAFSGLLLINASGCVAVLAGSAGGAGTAVWLSNKLTQEFHAPYERTISAAEAALKSLNLELAKKTKEEHVTQLKSHYTDGKEIWIDIRKVSENSTKVEVRVGAVHPDKDASSKILKRIASYL